MNDISKFKTFISYLQIYEYEDGYENHRHSRSGNRNGNGRQRLIQQLLKTRQTIQQLLKTRQTTTVSEIYHILVSFS